MKHSRHTGRFLPAGQLLMSRCFAERNVRMDLCECEASSGQLQFAAVLLSVAIQALQIESYARNMRNLLNG